MTSYVRTLSGLLLLASASVAAHDDSAIVYDQVDFSASAEQEIANDLLVAELYVEHQGQRQTAVADQVNTAMRWALDRARAVAGVEVETAQYSTYPIYANEGTTITGWRARQSLRLESPESRALSDLVGALQEKLAVSAIGYTVSKAARDRAEDVLRTQALAQFQARAQQIADALMRPGYRIVRIGIQAGGDMPPPIVMKSRMLAESAAATPPAIEAGRQTVNMTVSGTIQLDPAP